MIKLKNVDTRLIGRITRLKLVNGITVDCIENGQVKLTVSVNNTQDKIPVVYRVLLMQSALTIKDGVYSDWSNSSTDWEAQESDCLSLSSTSSSTTISRPSYGSDSGSKQYLQRRKKSTDSRPRIRKRYRIPPCSSSSPSIEKYRN